MKIGPSNNPLKPHLKWSSERTGKRIPPDEKSDEISRRQKVQGFITERKFFNPDKDKI